MARVQLVMSDEDRDLFAAQARREGMSFSAWLRAAARERFEARGPDKRFTSVEELREFFRTRTGLDGPEREPDWEEHLRTLDESIRQGLPDV